MDVSRRLYIPLAAILLLCFSIPPGLSQIQHDVVVRNIQVPVRVFSGDDFVSNLKLEDFEVLQDGVPQKLEALYLIKAGDIDRKQEEVGYFPHVSRKYYLLFQLIDYNPLLADAIQYFFSHIVQEDDSLTVQTSMQNYYLPPQMLRDRPRQKIAADLIDIVRRDTTIGNSNYIDLLNELKRIVRAVSSISTGVEERENSGIESDSTSSMFGLSFLLPRYKETLEKMENLRMVHEDRIIQFAKSLKRLEGEKVVIFFYQREYRPEINQNYVNTIISTSQNHPDVLSDLQDIAQYHREIGMNIKKMQNIFADASILFNFIFMNKEPENIIGVTMREQSEDTYRAFTGIADATGGVVDTSMNPFAGFKKAAQKTESYYLLFYSPKNYTEDGLFKTITVKVKNPRYKVLHRKGYFAD